MVKGISWIFLTGQRKGLGGIIAWKSSLLECHSLKNGFQISHDWLGEHFCKPKSVTFKIDSIMTKYSLLTTELVAFFFSDPPHQWQHSSAQDNYGQDIPQTLPIESSRLFFKQQACLALQYTHFFCFHVPRK